MIQVKELESSRDLNSFIKLPWRIYNDYPRWVPPLISNQKRQLSPDYPFWKHAERALFLAKKGNEVVGRASVCIDHNFVKKSRENTGFFGFFESFNDLEIAESLLEKTKLWGKEKGLERLIGPISPSTNDVLGILVKGFDSPPMIMMPYNPPYYQALMDAMMLKEILTLFAYEVTISYDTPNLLKSRLEAIESRKKLKNIELNNLSFDDFGSSVEEVMEVYNNAWANVWGFVPWEKEEILDIAKSIKSFLVA